LNKKQNKIYNWLLEHPGYLKKSPFWLYVNMNSSKTVKCKEKDCEIALKQAKITNGTVKLTLNYILIFHY